jgi:cobalt/nickel transport system permease protein
LKIFFIPDIFIFVLDIAIKYILLLGEYTLNMLYALRLRSIGRNNNKYTSLSGIAGTMFTRSREMAEEMHAAMECRGFTGEYSRPSRFSFHLMDAGLIALAAVAVLLFLYLK